MSTSASCSPDKADRLIFSIRLMFSIADIQNEQESEFEQGEEGEETSEDQPIHSYPIRCSLSVTKVRKAS